MPPTTSSRRRPLRYTHVAFVLLLELPAVPAGGAVSQPHPAGATSSPALAGIVILCLRHVAAATTSPTAPRSPTAARRHPRRHLHRSAARGHAPHHRLDHADRRRSCSSPMRCSGRICRRRGRTAASISRGWSVICSSRSEGIFGVAVDVSSSLIILFTIYGAVPAAFRRRQVLHRLLAGGDGQQAVERRPRGGRFVVPARRSVRLGRRHHGHDRRRWPSR